MDNIDSILKTLENIATAISKALEDTLTNPNVEEDSSNDLSE